MSFKPTNPNLFFTKNDPQDLRLGDVFKSRKSTELVKPTQKQTHFSLVGYPDHEGIQLNGGRIGSAGAPDKIREFLYKMTPPLMEQALEQLSFSDLGNIEIHNTSLEERHKLALDLTETLYRQGQQVISFGGGHDYGYADAAAFIKAHEATAPLKPVVLNFDAHLDVRPLKNGFNSGTPFYRLLSDFGGQFEFAEIGIQPQCNSVHHRTWARNQGAHIFDLSTIEQNGGLTSLLDHPLFQTLTPETPLFVSFDIDGLRSSEAGGCSQSWATGLEVSDFLSFFKKLSHLCNIRGLGIYEVSPDLDIDNRTSKTAALIAYHYMFQRNL